MITKQKHIDRLSNIATAIEEEADLELLTDLSEEEATKVIFRRSKAEALRELIFILQLERLRHKKAMQKLALAAVVLLGFIAAFATLIYGLSSFAIALGVDFESCVNQVESLGYSADLCF